MAKRSTRQNASVEGPSGVVMDLSALRAILDSEKQAAMAAYRAGKLSIDRAKALDYYYGDVSSDIADEDGKSKAVSMDVMETVEGLLPTMCDIFTGGDDIVRFEPTSPSDVKAAEQETDYVNYVFMEENPGFLLLYNFFKDAFISKTGIIKVTWQEEEGYEQQSYWDLTDMEYQVLISDKTLEIIAHTEKDTPTQSEPLHEPEINRSYT